MGDRREGGVFITGGAGLLGLNWALAVRDRMPVTLALHERRIAVRGASARVVDLGVPDEVRRAVDEARPALVVHTAGMTSVDACERNPAEARRVNVVLAGNVARAAAAAAVPMVHISTDHLFSSDKPLMSEDDPISPVNVYARTKADGETCVLDAHPRPIVARTNFYGWGPRYRRSFSDTILDALRAGQVTPLFDDVYYTPIVMERLIESIHDLAGRGAAGVFNVSGDERLSKWEFGVRVARHFGLDTGLVERGSLDRFSGTQRPRQMGLSNLKLRSALGRSIGGIDDHLAILARQERAGFAAEMATL